MSEAPGMSERQPRTVELGAILWIVATAVFIALRIGPLLNLPVAGAEAVHLAGAWQARIGIDDDRFVPTLFQALSAALLNGSDSEMPSRWLALAATSTIPAALWLLRPKLGNAGALLGLILLAVDAPAAVLGASASAMGFDLTLTVWLVVVAFRGWDLKLGWAGAGVLLATSGPIALPLLFALAIRLGVGRQGVDPRWVAAGAAGVLAGVAAASLRFGLGWDGLRVPPLDLFAASFEERWSSATALALTAMYVWPIVGLGLGALVWRLYRWYDQREVPDTMLLTWAGIAAIWWLVDLTGRGGVSTVALTLPLALLAGPALNELAAVARRADWATSGIALGLAALFAAMALAVVLDWAEFERAGPSSQGARVAIFSTAAVLLLGFLASGTATRRALAVLPGLALVALLSGGVNAGFVAEDDALPSPFVPEQARALRDLALEQAAERGGDIVVHARFEKALTWPFRDSGTLVVSSRVPPNAAVLLWPAGEPRPEGFDVVEGNWALTRDRVPPTGGTLPYLHWLFDRNTLRTVSDGVAVYVKGAE